MSGRHPKDFRLCQPNMIYVALISLIRQITKTEADTAALFIIIQPHFLFVNLRISQNTAFIEIY